MVNSFCIRNFVASLDFRDGLCFNVSRASFVTTGMIFTAISTFVYPSIYSVVCMKAGYRASFGFMALAAFCTYRLALAVLSSVSIELTIKTS